MEGPPRRPAEHAPRLGGLATQTIDFGGTEVARIDDHVRVHVDAGVSESERAELVHRGGAPKEGRKRVEEARKLNEVLKRNYLDFIARRVEDQLDLSERGDASEPGSTGV